MLKDQMSHAEITQEDNNNEKSISDRDHFPYDYGGINRMFRGQETRQPCCIYHIIRRQRNEKVRSELTPEQVPVVISGHEIIVDTTTIQELLDDGFSLMVSEWNGDSILQQELDQRKRFIPVPKTARSLFGLQTRYLQESRSRQGQKTSRQAMQRSRDSNSICPTK